MGIETPNNDIQAKLSALGEQFNPNKSFGLMGMLEAHQEQQTSGLAQQAESAQPAAPAAEPEIPQWIEPLNASLRHMQNQTRADINRLESKISQTQMPGGEPVADENQDPISKELAGIRQDQSRLKLNTAYERAKNALNSKKIANPDFDYSEQELQELWTSQIGNNADYADSIRWDDYFDTQVATRKAPKLESRIKELETQLAQAQSTRNSANDLSSVPRSARTGPAPQPQSNSDFDEEIYRRATARMSKHGFKGFNKILVEEQNKSLLSRAS